MKLNLINKKYSDLDYKIFHFPDGEVQIEILSEIDHTKDIEVICRITNAEELFIVMQVNDILTRHEITWTLYIKYLMSMEVGRIISFNRPYSLKVITNIIDEFSCSNVFVLEPHFDIKSNKIVSDWWTIPAFYSYNVVLPDKETMNRYFLYDESYFTEILDTEVKPFEFHPSKDIDLSKPFLFYSDICNDYETFVCELEILKEKYPDSKFEIKVCHATTMESIKSLCKVFDKVTITNSYKDWARCLAGVNLEIIDVCK